MVTRDIREAELRAHEEEVAKGGTSSIVVTCEADGDTLRPRLGNADVLAFLHKHRRCRKAEGGRA